MKRVRMHLRVICWSQGECDVVPMHAGHLLLGKPWQYYRRVIHDGFKDRYSFVLMINVLYL